MAEYWLRKPGALSHVIGLSHLLFLVHRKIEKVIKSGHEDKLLWVQSPPTASFLLSFTCTITSNVSIVTCTPSPEEMGLVTNVSMFT